MYIIKKIWKTRKNFYYLISSIYFNLHYLPFKQAIKLPILLYKPKLVKTKGKIIIDTPDIKFGMIRFGFWRVTLYPNSGIIYENNGGTIIFRGDCTIGNNSSISIAKSGNITFGENFLATSSFKIASYRNIEFGKKTRIGWDSLIMDTNFHPIMDIKTGKNKKASGPIKIGDYNWFGNKCTIMHSVTTPERCIYGMSSILTRGNISESYCVHAGNPLKVVTRDVMRDYDNDIETYD